MYLASTWGAPDFSLQYTGPQPARPPEPRYYWDRIPTVNAIYEREMRRRGVAVVDPTVALSQRPDCRKDYMHHDPQRGFGVLAQSTWRLLLAALSPQTALPDGASEQGVS